jgi:hypothetical protein
MVPPQASLFVGLFRKWSSGTCVVAPADGVVSLSRDGPRSADEAGSYAVPLPPRKPCVSAYFVSCRYCSDTILRTLQGVTITDAAVDGAADEILERLASYLQRIPGRSTPARGAAPAPAPATEPVVVSASPPLTARPAARQR